MLKVCLMACVVYSVTEISEVDDTMMMVVCCAIRVFAAIYADFHPNVHSGGIPTDGNANAYEYFIQIWRKVRKLCTHFPTIFQKWRCNHCTSIKTSETT